MDAKASRAASMPRAINTIATRAIFIHVIARKNSFDTYRLYSLVPDKTPGKRKFIAVLQIGNNEGWVCPVLKILEADNAY